MAPNDDDSITHVNDKKTETPLDQGIEISTLSPEKASSGDLEKGTARTDNKIELDDEIYNRFSKSRKKAIVAIVSFAALLARTYKITLRRLLPPT